MYITINQPYTMMMKFYNLIFLFRVSSLRLWYPQITAIFENYQKEHNKTEWFCPIVADYTDSLKQKNLMEVPDFINNITVEKVQECVTVIITYYHSS